MVSVCKLPSSLSPCPGGLGFSLILVVLMLRSMWYAGAPWALQAGSGCRNSFCVTSVVTGHMSFLIDWGKWVWNPGQYRQVKTGAMPEGQAVIECKPLFWRSGNFFPSLSPGSQFGDSPVASYRVLFAKVFIS